MKNIIITLLFVFVLVSLSAGCSYYSTDLKAFLGISIRDLEKARDHGNKQIFPMSFETAFGKVKEIIEVNNLTIYQINKKEGYIVAMGFPKQTNTTRVGIFLEPLSDNETEITLSSLSSTALEKATPIIFGGLER